APLHLLLVSVPAYFPPADGMVVICDLLTSGTFMGKVMVFFLLGLGLSVGTLAWIGWSFGIRALIGSVAVAAIVGLGFGYALPFSLPSGDANADNVRPLLEIESGGT